jgi:hypothetical protein
LDHLILGGHLVTLLVEDWGITGTGRKTRSGVGQHELLLHPPLVAILEGSDHVLRPLTEREGGATHHAGCVLRRIRP